MLNEYITKLCLVLNIPLPNISFDTSDFKSLTMLAQCDAKNNMIYVKNLKITNPDLFFSIAHEIRHLWQYQTNYKEFLSNYKTVDVLGLEKYNAQPAEIDANAFSSIIMTELFHLQPLWNGLSHENIIAIQNRANNIKHDYLDAINLYFDHLQ